MKKYLVSFPFEIGAVALAIAAALILSFSLSTHRADANQSYFTISQLNSSATTTQVYITAGTATTTLNAANGDGSTALESAIVNFQITSSTTPPSLSIRPEVSRDGIDWYPMPQALNLNATTTLMTAGSMDYKWTGMASSTDMAGSGTPEATSTVSNLHGARYHGSLILSTPEPYVRVKFYVPAGAPAISLWASIIGKKEQLAR